MESAQGEDSGSKFLLLYTNAACRSGTERVHVTPFATIWWVLSTEHDSPFPWPSKIMLKNAFTLPNLEKLIFNEKNVYVCVACMCGSVGAICHTAYIWRAEDKFRSWFLTVTIFWDTVSCFCHAIPVSQTFWRLSVSVSVDFEAPCRRTRIWTTASGSLAEFQEARQ